MQEKNLLENSNVYIVTEEDIKNNVLIKSDEKYEVEKILDKRRNESGKLEYLVKWKASLNFEDSWEPFSNVCIAYSKLFEYESSLKAKNPNYKYDDEIYYLYEKIRFDKLNEKEQFSKRDPAKIVNIFKLNNNIMLKVKWKMSSLGKQYDDSYFRLSDCLLLPKVTKLFIRQVLKKSDYISN